MRKHFSITAYQTQKVVGIGDDLFLQLSKIPVRENTVLAISSKVVSLCENRVVAKAQVKNLDALIKTEAERYIDRKRIPGRHAILTMKNQILTASAGVDEFDGVYVLWPKSPRDSAVKIWRKLKRAKKLKKFGVVITDSHTVPLRRGIVGFALAYCGFRPLRRYVGKKNVFGRVMKATQANLVDAMASAAVLAMGEGGERTPFAVLSGVPGVEFTKRAFAPASGLERFEVPLEEDLYRPLIVGRPWRKS